MTNRWRKILALAGPCVLLALLLMHSWFGPDIWYHLTWGRDILSRRSFLPAVHVLLLQPIYGNGYWLFQILITMLMNAGGIVTVSAAFAALWFGIAYLWIRQTRAGDSVFWGPLLFLAFVICAQLRFEARPEIFSYLFLILMIRILTGIDWQAPLRRTDVVALLAIQIIWNNCHGYFVFGPLLGLAALFAVFAGGQGKSAALRAAALSAVLFAATWVSPFPLGNWRAVLAYVDVSRGLRDLNQELQPPAIFPLYWPITIFWFYWLTMTVFAFWNVIKRREIFATVLGLAGSLLATQATRNIPLFLLLSAPAAGLLLNRARKFTSRKILIYLPSAAAFVLALSVVRGDYFRSQMSLGSFGVKLETSAYPVRVAQFLRDIHFRGKLFCDSYDGGYLEYYLPEIKVAGDSYFSDPGLTLSFFAAIRGPAALRAMDTQLHFDGLLINIENQDVVDALWGDSHWKLVYADLHRLLFLNAGYFNGPPIDLLSVTLYHGEDLSHWTYAFGADTWAGMALKRGDADLMRKIFAEISASPVIPAPAIKYGLLLARRLKDKNLFELALTLRAKMIAMDGVSLEEVRAAAADTERALSGTL